MQPIKLNDYTVIKWGKHGEFIIKQFDDVKEEWSIVYLTTEDIKKIIRLISK